MATPDLVRPAPGIWREVHAEAEPRRRSEGRSAIRRAVAQFAISGIAALILLGAAGVYLLRQIGQSEAIRNAKQVAALAGHGVAEPNITAGLSRGDPAAVAQLDRAVGRGLLGGRIVRVKIWNRDGRILYSDEHRLIGSRYRLGPDELNVLAAGKVEAEVSDLKRPENRFERPFKKLLEVYLPIRGADGRPLLFESYERYSSVAASGRKLWLSFAPAILGTLALLWLIQLPLAWRVGRRLGEGQAEREKLLRRAIESSELERRRIARDLHDGAVQDLAGVAYSLSAAADSIQSVSHGQTADVMKEAATGARRTIRQLRTLLVDIYPPDLHRAGLESALRDLTAPLGARGIEAQVEVPDDLELRRELELLFYRCAQEALRNVATHSSATRVDVKLVLDDGLARLTVDDDGRGFEGSSGEGHMGLRLLADLAGEAGGQLSVDSEPGHGTRVCVEAPL
ncbi:MAG: two-component system, NarL family, sensor kinase [Gaiellaceae bacterium]|nr:two-component system, NarL family, sensor kinase [Gaiellaceae bacterium]